MPQPFFSSFLKFLKLAAPYQEKPTTRRSASENKIHDDTVSRPHHLRMPTFLADVGWAGRCQEHSLHVR
jgi:hypothetical protein